MSSVKCGSGGGVPWAGLWRAWYISKSFTSSSYPGMLFSLTSEATCVGRTMRAGEREAGRLRRGRVAEQVNQAKDGGEQGVEEQDEQGEVEGDVPGRRRARQRARTARSTGPTRTTRTTNGARATTTRWGRGLWELLNSEAGAGEGVQLPHQVCWCDRLRLAECERRAPAVRVEAPPCVVDAPAPAPDRCAASIPCSRAGIGERHQYSTAACDAAS